MSSRFYLRRFFLLKLPLMKVKIKVSEEKWSQNGEQYELAAYPWQFRTYSLFLILGSQRRHPQRSPTNVDLHGRIRKRGRIRPTETQRPSGKVKGQRSKAISQRSHPSPQVSLETVDTGIFSMKNRGGFTRAKTRSGSTSLQQYSYLLEKRLFQVFPPKNRS